MSFLNHIPFGLIGLGLAVLDFSGASRKVEAGLIKYRNWVSKSTRYWWRQLSLIRKGKLTKTTAHKPKLLYVDLLIGLMVAVLIGISYALSSERMALSMWILLPLLPIAFLLTSIGIGVIIIASNYMISTLVYRLFWLLSRPKAGILGTVGLVLTALATGQDYLDL